MVRTIRSPKLQKKYKILLIIKVTAIIFAISAMVALPTFLSRANFLKIQSIEVEGNSVVDAQKVREAVQGQMSGNYWYLFSKSNIALFPKSKVEESLLVAFSRIESVRIERLSLTSLLVVIKERKPKNLWCKDTETRACYFIDSEGLIFDRAPEFSADVYTVYTGQVAGEPIGARYTGQDDFAKLQTVILGMSNLGLEVDTVSNVNNRSYELGLKSNGVIIISLADDPVTITSNLQSVIEDRSLSVFENGALTVQALDLRYGNKIIIKK